MDRGERRRRAEVKMKRNEKILRDFGYRGGTIYERHIAKVEESLGYTRKHGNITHYAQVGFGEKTTNRNSYDGVNNYSPRDQRNIDKANIQIKEQYMED